MYLKSLVIRGFKSFADKTNIRFEKNITAVVGPNGSGKSNISDAIRWVLGEQSTKTLRGSKMEDVIFAGTEKRPPVGSAEVSLTLDNSDGKMNIDSTEVTATRRYYRSGESEFFINNKPVRLRDIHELFMDTGMGRDGYSVIGQGKIDEILSVRSDERRDFFEEAAGITKYRYRKEEAENKLRSAEENLTRIRDITSELESRIEPLSNQAERAEKFLSLSGELRILDVSCLMDDIDKNSALKSELAADLSNAQAAAQNIRSELEAEDNAAEELSRKIHQSDVDAEKLRGELAQSDGLIAAADNQISICETKISSNNENTEQAMSEFSEHTSKLSDISSVISQKKSEAEQYSAELLEYSEKANATAAEADVFLKNSVQSEADANAVYADERMHSERLSGFTAEQAAAASVLNELNTRLADNRKLLSEKKAELDNLCERKIQSEKKLSENEAATLSLTNAVKGLELKIQSAQNKTDDILRRKQELEIRLKTLSAGIDMLEKMEKQYDGFSYAVKQLMKQASSGGLKNICGTVSDLIKVPDSYVTAIETSLGGAVASIVTETENDAKVAINYLKSSNSGRATFLPLSSVKPASFSDTSVLSESGICGLASELCRFDSKYSNAVKSLLGRVVIAENLDVAIKAANKYSHRFKIVTLDGQVMNSGGSMTGGSSDKKSGVLSRANELEKKIEEKNSVSAELSEITDTYKQAAEKLNAIKFQLSSANEELAALKAEATDISAECKQCSVMTDIASSAITALENEEAAASARLNELKQKQDALSENIRSENEILSRLRDKQKELSESKAEISEKYKSALEKINAVRQQAAEISALKAAAESALGELENQLALTTKTRKQRELLINEYAQKNKELTENINRLNLQKERQENISSSIKSQIARIVSERQAAEALRTSKEKSSKAKNEELLNTEREILRLSNKITQIDESEKRIIDKLWDEYGLTKSTAEDVRLVPNEYSAATKKITELKSRIKALGPVNTDSIAEFKQVNERYQFMCAQRDDLEKSKRELQRVISDIVENMKTIFVEQFSLINSNFNQTFAEIFGGGGASLELTDENDVLNCGIEINVKIPGKSLKAISLLSGGEKAFVAIALYFAILKVRPAPFCVLDEIEAALDDVNVDRYANYLHKLCDSTQFIVITHRRGTMEKSEMLYGVTMQEKGVSGLLALNINDAEKKLGINLN